ncbi:hypothetical protein L9F63_016208 [Diploptera punctata]|uniref:Uncharacterized protein n=1 Tax=Diploptera punctata TaxID=6984 RepID=A0AAD8A1K8_DIPPU|nr:hypothetical protein L9F63_016208 [Diploptera punctata]
MKSEDITAATEGTENMDQNCVEENPFTYEILLKETDAIKLPSSLWAVHKEPNGRFVAFSRMPVIRTGRLIADKAVVFAGQLVPSVFFREMKLNLPMGHFVQELVFRTQLRSSKCRIYVDMPSFAQRCTACTLQHQALICAAKEKKT